MILHYRDATEADLPAIVAMLADDPLGATREDTTLPLAPAYRAAFEAITAAPHQRLIVAVDGDIVIGTMQLLLIPALSRRGSWRGQIEGVRIASSMRGDSYGAAFVRWAIEQCRAAGCISVHLPPITAEARRIASGTSSASGPRTWVSNSSCSSLFSAQSQ